MFRSPARPEIAEPLLDSVKKMKELGGQLQLGRLELHPAKFLEPEAQREVAELHFQIDNLVEATNVTGTESPVSRFDIANTRRMARIALVPFRPFAPSAERIKQNRRYLEVAPETPIILRLARLGMAMTEEQRAQAHREDTRQRKLLLNTFYYEASPKGEEAFYFETACRAVAEGSTDPVDLYLLASQLRTGRNGAGFVPYRHKFGLEPSSASVGVHEWTMRRVFDPTTQAFSRLLNGARLPHPYVGRINHAVQTALYHRYLRADNHYRSGSPWVGDSTRNVGMAFAVEAGVHSVNLETLPEDPIGQLHLYELHEAKNDPNVNLEHVLEYFFPKTVQRKRQELLEQPDPLVLGPNFLQRGLQRVRRQNS